MKVIDGAVFKAAETPPRNEFAASTFIAKVFHYGSNWPVTHCVALHNCHAYILVFYHNLNAVGKFNCRLYKK
jgi:hypothetical protein